MGTGSLLTQWMAKYGYVPITLIGVAGLALEIGTGEWQGGETVVAKNSCCSRNSRCGRNSCCAPRLLLSPSLLMWPTSTIEAEAPVVAGAPVERRSPAPESKSEPKAKTQLAALDPYVRLPDQVRPARLEGLHHVCQLARVLDAGAAARRHQLRPRAAQQHTRRDRAGSSAVQCRRADDEGICQDRVPATIRKPRPAGTSACSSFPTGNLPNIGMATSTTSATARSRRQESLPLRPSSSRRTSAAKPRLQNSTASTSRGIRAVRFITTRQNSWHGRTCT